MKYVSTRGQAPVLDFDDALLCGLARDGGLYVPEIWPQLGSDEIKALQGLSYTDTAFAIIRPFTVGTIDDDDLGQLIVDAYAGFDDPDVAPMVQLGDGQWLMELFHGPTLAFKDLAMQFLGRMFDHVLGRRGQRVTIVGATSGDTGSAAIEACRGRAAIEIFILHPEGLVSDVQRRQMTTINDANVHNIAIKGTFDDCQNMVKAMFNDNAFRERINLSAVNSINWARVMAQCVYYFYAAARLGTPGGPVSFAVPTGNFGNVFAGYGASRMGLNIEQLIIGSNSNDILTRFFETGNMQTTGVHPTISPSMDIQISSNFERLLFELYDRDASKIRELMSTFNDSGSFSVGAAQMRQACQLFSARRFSDDQTRQIIKQVLAENQQLIDPHSAIAVGAGRAKRGTSGAPLIALATAHPAKFPDAVMAASGQYPKLPEKLSGLFEREEHFSVLDNDLAQVQEFIETIRTDSSP